MSQIALFAQVNRIVQRDAFEFLALLPSNSVDLIITDPPYESLEKHRAKGTTTRLDSFWFPTMPNSRFPELLSTFYSVLKKDRHFYLFCDDETSDVVIPAAKAVGFTYWKRIVWDKMIVGTGYHYRNQHEFILFFEKGKRKLNNLGIGSVLRHRAIRLPHDHKDYYPTQKPVTLMELLINQSTTSGELILDPFAGSGASLLAAKVAGRHYWGCDIQEEAVGLAKRRLHVP